MSSILTKFKRRAQQQLRRKAEREIAIATARAKEKERIEAAAKLGITITPFEPKHEPGTFAQSSDRSYLVQPDGSFRRILQGERFRIGREVRVADGKGWLILDHVLPPEQDEPGKESAT